MQSPDYFGYVHEAEHQTHRTMFDDPKDHDVPCAVCRTNSSNVMVVPAKQTCPTGWIRECFGYLIISRNAHASANDFICMDGNPEALTGSYLDKNGTLFHF